MKKIGLWVAIVLGAIALTILTPTAFKYFDLSAADLNTNGIIPQKYLSEGEKKEVISIYYKEDLLGIVHDVSEYEEFLDSIYEEKYQEDFPDSSVGLGEDIHISKTISALEVEDKDEEIFKYLEDHNFFSIMGYKIEFDNGSVAYAKSSEDFIKAREDFVLNFLESDGVDPVKTKKLLDNNQKTSTYSKDKMLDLSYSFLNPAKISNELVPIDLILKNYDECITWLSFGYDYQPKYYTVEEGDMIQGIASKNGVSVMNLISTNSETIKSSTQLLQVGEKVNVTQIDSPIQIEVVKQRVAVEPDYPEDTKYEYDPTMREGQRKIKQKYKEGSYRVSYKETYVNGELVENKTQEISRLQIEPSQQEIVVIGTMVIPNVGSGNFRYPVDNVNITCGWYCYAGHQAIDVQNRYNKYGAVRAADRGTVIVNSSGAINGYYMIIDHNNGFYTYYGHMNRPGYFDPGTTVSKGEVIGQIGMTGLATGPHVHFEVRTSRSGGQVNPLNYIGG